MKFHLRNLNRPEHDYSGMTVLELLLAIAMFVVFTGVVVMVMQFTLRFFSAAESGKPNKLGASDGVLIDHGKLHIAMDAFVEVLSQPGVSMKGIAFSQSDQPNVACQEDPVSKWGLEMLMDEKEITDLLPPGYRLCLLKTTEIETASSAGIYLLQALPEQLSASGLPTRRLFCRPRPLC